MLLKSKLTVEERVDAALKLLQVLEPGIPVSVSRLAKAAKVSRANLYVSHPELIANLRRPEAKTKPQRAMSASEQLEKLRAELAQSRLENKALLYLTGELRGEVNRLKLRLESLTRRRLK